MSCSYSRNSPSGFARTTCSDTTQPGMERFWNADWTDKRDIGLSQGPVLVLATEKIH